VSVLAAVIAVSAVSVGRACTVLSYGSDNSLVVRLEAVALAAGSATVRVSILNVGSSYLLVVPRFVPETLKDPQAWPVLRFAIRDAAGELVARTGKWLGDRLREPSPDELLVLGSGDFWGSTIDLTEGEYAHAFHESGVYYVEVTVESSARRWVRSRSTRLDVDQVFEGAITSVRVPVRVETE
jgi:hypothetical protein